MFTITGPGGERGDFDTWAWNVQAWPRFAHLRDLAGKQASREVAGVSSRLVAWVPELQGRGMLHFHLVFEAATLAEKRWAERYCRYLRRHAQEHGFGPETSKGKWGRGEVGRYVGKLARYLTKGGDEMLDLWEAGDAPGRCFYVSRRLTEATQCTIRRLRLSARAWAAQGLSIPVTTFPEWWQYERALGRALTWTEQACLRGVAQRAPPLGAAVGSDSAR